MSWHGSLFIPSPPKSSARRALKLLVLKSCMNATRTTFPWIWPRVKSDIPKDEKQQDAIEKHQQEASDELGQKEESQEQNNDCHGKRCNPFQVCSTCVLSVNKLALIDNLSKPKPPVKSRFTYQSSLSSQYVSDFWQPPKFV